MKKGLLLIGAVAICLATVPMFAAFEAHVINVTAHIENALAVHPTEIAFGTVFPQEYLTRQFTVAMSSSFLAAGRVDDINYVIKQKAKPIDANPAPDAWTKPTSCTENLANVDEARAYCEENPQDQDCCYLSLCPYLSKTDADPVDNNDISHPSYFVPATTSTPAYCITPGPDATGHLSKIAGDPTDLWVVDLKVPPVAGTVGQDWPDGCPTVVQNNQDYGCDLWIEVTGISETPQ